MMVVKLRTIATAGLMLAGMLASGCARSAPPPRSALLDAEGVARTARVQPGDQIALKIFREPDMSGSFTVGQDGEVVLPRLGAVHVGGRGVVELQDSLRSAFSVFLRNPSVEIQVLRRVGVQGAVTRPDLYMVDLTTTLRDVIAMAGGVTEYGDPGKVSIIRNGQKLHLGSGELAQFLAAELLSGDQVLIGQRNWFERNSLAIAGTAAAVVPAVLLIFERIGSDQ